MVEMADKEKQVGLTQEDLAEILESYNEATEKLRRSHELLQREVKRLREELASKNRQLERRKRLAALGEMAAGLAHEIRNPLAGIQLYANILKRDLEDRPQLQVIVEKIIMGVRMLETLVSNVLALTHTIEPNFKRSDLVSLINSAVDFLRSDIEQHNVSVYINAPAELLIECDPEMIKRSFMNLVKNAIEASSDGGSVFINAYRRSGVVVIKIADTGPGVDESIADKIFNPFFTTKDSGSGLGLSIVHRIVEAHGGEISLERSRDTGGALFTIRLPEYASRSKKDASDRG